MASPPPFPHLATPGVWLRGRTDEGVRITIPHESFHAWSLKRELDFPTKGEMAEAMYLEGWWEGDPMHETMGLRGTDSLWILDRPYILVSWEPEGLSLLYSFAMISCRALSFLLLFDS